jgi:hypothetical protein
MTLPNGWTRVSRNHTCPICEKPDWCLVHEDGTTVCARTQSDIPFGNNGAGWVHQPNGGGAGQRLPRALQPAKPAAGPPPDFTILNKRCRAAMTGTRWRKLSESLQVGVTALTELQVGWHSDLLANTFPMFDARRNVIGIRLRAIAGRKWAITGSRNGLFLPFTPPPVVKNERTGRVYVVEGPTDLAALLNLGLYGIGRPDNQSGNAMIAQFMAIHRPESIVILHDTDPPGTAAAELTRLGAHRLAGILRRQWRSVYIMQPIKAKDLREWIERRGIQARHIESIADSRSLAIGV